MVVTSVRKEVMIGEHARCLYKMSEILQQIPGRELEADRYLKEAEELHWQRKGRPEVMSTGEVELAEQVSRLSTRDLTEDDYDALVFLTWR